MCNLAFVDLVELQKLKSTLVVQCSGVTEWCYFIVRKKLWHYTVACGVWL